MTFEFVAKFPLLTIIVVSLLVSLATTLIYKFMTDQKKMKQLREDQKKYQKEMRECRNDMKKMQEINKKAMDASMQYFVASMKPTLVTFIPVILVFIWLASTIAYQPITPGEEFNITVIFAKNAEGSITLKAEGLTIIGNVTKQPNSNVVWTLKAEKEGIYTLDFEKEGEPTITKDVLISNTSYLTPELRVNEKGSSIKLIRIENKPTRPFGENFNLFGWHPGWLSAYIIFSLIFSMSLRKIMKIY